MALTPWVSTEQITAAALNQRLTETAADIAVGGIVRQLVPWTSLSADLAGELLIQNNIPQTYAMLRLVGLFRTTQSFAGSDNRTLLNLRLNDGDVGTAYAWITKNASATTNGPGTNTYFYGAVQDSNGDAGQFSFVTLEFANYWAANGTPKHIMGHSMFSSATGHQKVEGFMTYSGNPIAKLALDVSGDFTAGCGYALYGIGSRAA
jgi:hypothetical protein